MTINRKFHKFNNISNYSSSSQNITYYGQKFLPATQPEQPIYFKMMEEPTQFEKYYKIKSLKIIGENIQQIVKQKILENQGHLIKHFNKSVDDDLINNSKQNDAEIPKHMKIIDLQKEIDDRYKSRKVTNKQRSDYSFSRSSSVCRTGTYPLGKHLEDKNDSTKNFVVTNKSSEFTIKNQYDVLECYKSVSPDIPLKTVSKLTTSNAFNAHNSHRKYHKLKKASESSGIAYSDILHDYEDLQKVNPNLS